MKLFLVANQNIRMISPDNKAMYACCTSLLKNEPALDLLPRVRYMIDLETSHPIFVPSARLLFDLGLHLVPIVKPGTTDVTNIVAINLSDKIIRMFNGMQLSDDTENYNALIVKNSEHDTSSNSSILDSLLL
jgi:hypothetical protein